MDKMPISTDFTVLYFSIQKESDSSDPKFDNSKIELEPNETYRARFSLRVLNNNLNLKRINLVGYKGNEIIAYTPLNVSSDMSLKKAKAIYFAVEFKIRDTTNSDMNLILSYEDERTKDSSAFDNIVFFTNVLIKQGQTDNE